MNQAVRCFFCTKLPASVRNSSSFLRSFTNLLDRWSRLSPPDVRKSINKWWCPAKEPLSRMIFIFEAVEKDDDRTYTHANNSRNIRKFCGYNNKFEIQGWGQKSKVGTKIRTSRNWNFYRYGILRPTHSGVNDKASHCAALPLLACGGLLD